MGSLQCTGIVQSITFHADFTVVDSFSGFVIGFFRCGGLATLENVFLFLPQSKHSCLQIFIILRDLLSIVVRISVFSGWLVGALPFCRGKRAKTAGDTFPVVAQRYLYFSRLLV